SRYSSARFVLGRVIAVPVRSEAARLPGLVPSGRTRAHYLPVAGTPDRKPVGAGFIFGRRRSARQLALGSVGYRAQARSEMRGALPSGSRWILRRALREPQ